jgi:hypothetical protein
MCLASKVANSEFPSPEFTSASLRFSNSCACNARHRRTLNTWALTTSEYIKMLPRPYIDQRSTQDVSHVMRPCVFVLGFPIDCRRIPNSFRLGS